jgi:hypothetical protein
MKENYRKIDGALCNMVRHFERAMVLCHTWGFNGFKRKYRMYALKFENFKLLLENEMFDDFGYVSDSSEEQFHNYMPSDFKAHCMDWLQYLSSAITILSENGKAIYNQSGKASCIVEDIIDCLYKEQEKSKRFLSRANKSGWNAHDLHIQDDMLHAKMKCREQSMLKGW